MESTKQKLVVIVSAGTAFVMCVAGFIFYMPLVKELRTQGDTAKALESEVAKSSERINFVKATGKGFLVVNENGLSVAIDELTKQAKSHNINLVSMSPQDPKMESEYGQLPIEVVIESGYSELGIFLGLLDKLQRSLVTVESFEVAPDPVDTRMLKTKLTLNMYFYR